MQSYGSGHVTTFIFSQMRRVCSTACTRKTQFSLSSSSLPQAQPNRKDEMKRRGQIKRESHVILKSISPNRHGPFSSFGLSHLLRFGEESPMRSDLDRSIKKEIIMQGYQNESKMIQREGFTGIGVCKKEL